MFPPLVCSYGSLRNVGALGAHAAGLHLPRRWPLLCLTPPCSPSLPARQGVCTTLGGLCVLDAKQLGRVFYVAGPWAKLSLLNVRLVNGNSRDEGGWLGCRAKDSS